MASARASRASLGFTMLEVLVSLIILMVGLLGLIGMQARTQVATFESYQRGQALILAQDMADRIATNRGTAACYVTSPTSPLGTGFSGTPTCGAAVGTTATRAVANTDLQAWNSLLQGASETASSNKIGGILGARGCVTYDATTNSYRVAVAWQGMAATVAPTAADAAATCGQNAYGGASGEPLRREINTIVRIANLN